MRIAVTGANGFLGRNLCLRLAELGYKNIVRITRDTLEGELGTLLADVDFVFHLAGVNRPKEPSEFASGNRGFAETLCAALKDRSVPVVFASSTQAALDNPYGASKRAAENVLFAYGERMGAPVYVYRLTNIFGKWSRPNYNSAVATFCHNVTRGAPITIHDPTTPLRLVYVDDVVTAFVELLDAPVAKSGFAQIEPVYETTVGAVAQAIRSFSEGRKTLITPPVGEGLMRALHATYLSFVPVDGFTYDVPVHSDPRGDFVEMLKTADSGQFSYFTAHPGVTRGEHYHHTKTEKFLVIRGKASFGFRNVDTGETAEIIVSGGEGRIVETVPGWAHNVTNVGADELICMLWANEIFDRVRPDTIAAKVRL